MKYAWAPGAPFGGDADKVQAEIERLRRTGGATPEAVVTAGRSKRSVFHPLIFNVAESVAAERYYLGRAGALLNSIRIVNEEGEVTHLRANVLVKTGESDEYRGLDDEAARATREAWLRGRLLSIKVELKELGLFPQIALVIEETLAA